MNILNTILGNALDENILNSISEKSGIETSNVQSLINELAPKLLNGAKQNLASDSDSTELINMISNVNLDSLKNDPSSIDNLNNNNMLGQLFGFLDENEDDIKRDLSSKSGIDISSISSLIPMVAPLVLGALNKNSNFSAMTSSDTNSVTSTLLNFLDQDQDGSVADDLMDMASKFFK